MPEQHPREQMAQEDNEESTPERPDVDSDRENAGGNGKYRLPLLVAVVAVGYCIGAGALFGAFVARHATSVREMREMKGQ